MRGKLIEGVLIYAPKNATVGKVSYIPAPDSVLADLGYKVIETTSPPDNEYDYICHFEEQNDKIVQVWELSPSSEDFCGET